MTTVTTGELARLGLQREGPYFVDQAREVGLLVGEFGAFVGWLDVAWDGPATPAPRLCDVIHLPFQRQDLIDREVSAARAGRVAVLVTCTMCGQGFTVGYTHTASMANVSATDVLRPSSASAIDASDELTGCASTVPRAIEASRGVGTSGPEVPWPKSPMALAAAE